MLPFARWSLAASRSTDHSPASAQEVIAERNEALRNGDVAAPGEIGRPLNQIRPEAYPKRPLVAGKSRAEVIAELRETVRTGDILASNDSGLREINQARYAKTQSADSNAARADTPFSVTHR